MGSAGEVVVLAKVVDTVIAVDAASGSVTVDPRQRICSAADHAALAIGDALARHHGTSVRVVSVGCASDATVLSEFAARVDCPVTLFAAADTDRARRVSSDSVSRALVDATAMASYVVAGDHSLDRGSASVPARLAEHLGWAQALGLLDVDVATSTAVRRLGGGRREALRFNSQTVLSVEAGAGRPPRATPPSLLAPRVGVLELAVDLDPEPHYAPYRVPPATVAVPIEPVASRRAMEVIGVLTPPRAREVLVATPTDAADAILDRLHEWGYR